MSKKCSRCDKTVYPIEELKCLDKTWHKACFKCYECGMTLNMKTYKGFNKQPYCNAHCPVARATTVVDTPETRRLAENTKIQSQVKYHEDFEKQKGKLTQIADDPETLRIRNTSKIISNVSYHGEYEKKKQMEERRNLLENENNNETQFSSALNEKTVKSAPYDYSSNNNIVLPLAKNVNSTTDYHQRNQYSSYGNNGNPIEQNRTDFYKVNNSPVMKVPATAGLNPNANYIKDPRYINAQIPPQMVTQQYHLQQQPQYQQQPQQQQQQQQQQPIYHDNHYYSGGIAKMPIQSAKAYGVTNLGRCFRAIYDYNAQDIDEVSFLDGDLIINCQPIDDGWMTGTVQRTGQTGMLPSNYVESA